MSTAPPPPIEGKLKGDSLAIQRTLVLRGGLFENLEIRNHDTRAVQVQVSLSFAVDFQDLFKVRRYGPLRPERGQDLQRTCQVNHRCEDADLSFAYQGLDGALMESRLQFVHLPPDHLVGNTAIWELHLDPQACVHLGYCLQPRTNGQPTSAVSLPTSLAAARQDAHAAETAWHDQITQIRSDNSGLNRIIHRAEQDIYLLLQSFEQGQECPGQGIAAGIPWFSALFGRDSLIAAGQTLILDPAIARDTLQIWAHYQGASDRDWHDENPGKILHELRLGEMARNREIPHTPYYGTVDATPLWLLLYADYAAWTGDQATLDALWPNAIAAMDWIDRECQATGYLTYAKRAARGIDNQGWKDSGDCMVNGAGQLVSGPIALCEVQAYVYAAKRRLAAIARHRQAPDLAKRWEQDAADLKARFNRDFWLPDQNYCALALDGDGQPVDSITSNPGHCLHSGLLDVEKAAQVAKRLQAPDLFSGWGIRTLSSDSPAYNPMGYHLGSVWPHDTALIALGLRAIGAVDAALAIAQSLLDMAATQPLCRPPELFCGYPRQPQQAPIPYPVACSPQAWATGSLFQMLQLMLNPIPQATERRLTIDQPTLPTGLDRLTFHNLRIGTDRFDLALQRVGSRVECQVLATPSDWQVVIAP